MIKKRIMDEEKEYEYEYERKKLNPNANSTSENKRINIKKNYILKRVLISSFT